AFQRDLGKVHHHDLGPGVERQLCSGGTHSGGSAHDENSLAVVTERIEEVHSVLSPMWERRRQATTAADLEVENGVDIGTDVGQDAIAILVELGSPFGPCGFFVQ